MNDLENDGKKWTWEETLIAFDLYSRIPYSKISGSNTDVIKTAILLKRKPGAVAKKLFNIAAHDPKQLSRGVSGLSHSSKLDKEIWDRFEENSFEMDDMEQHSIDNQAHQIIYSSLSDKFSELLLNKGRFLDESKGLYKDALQKYQL